MLTIECMKTNCRDVGDRVLHDGMDAHGPVNTTRMTPVERPVLIFFQKTPQRTGELQRLTH